MQLTQVQLVPIVSSAVSQVLTQHMQQTASNLPLAAAANNAEVQQVQAPTKFEMSAFEGENAGSWLTWGQRVIYQARACGFEAELTAAEGVGVSVGADVFDGSNVDPVRLRNAHAAWIALINNCREITFEIVQRSKAPNDAWRNLESHYKAKGTREILCLSHEVDWKTMQPWEDPFQFMI